MNSSALETGPVSSVDRSRTGPGSAARFSRAFALLRPNCVWVSGLVLLILFPSAPIPKQAAKQQLGPGIPERYDRSLPYNCGFGLSPDDPLQIDLSETLRFVRALQDWGVELLNVSAGSPYYNPHIQRPALFPPSDGYQPPEIR